MHSLSVFVADDEPDDCIAIQREFQRAGNQGALRLFADGKYLVDALEAGDRADCLLLDMDMPLLDGWGVLRYLRRHKLDEMPVFVMTSSDVHEVILGEKGCRPSAYLRKPVKLADVQQAMSTLDTPA